jgi:hypothetical protein
LESLETSFHQDLNGDGVIGIPAVAIESFGSTSLVQIGSNYFLNPVAGGTGPELQYAGAAVVAGQLSPWSPVGAEQTAGGYEVAWKSGTQYTVWNTDNSGHYISNIGVVSGNSATLESLETSFHQDLNGDGVIGVSASQAISSFHSGPWSAATSAVVATEDAFVFRQDADTNPRVSAADTDIIAFDELLLVSSKQLVAILDEAQTEQSHLSQWVDYDHDALTNTGGEYNGLMLHSNVGDFITH